MIGSALKSAAGMVCELAVTTDFEACPVSESSDAQNACREKNVNERAYHMWHVGNRCNLLAIHSITYTIYTFDGRMWHTGFAYVPILVRFVVTLYVHAN